MRCLRFTFLAAAAALLAACGGGSDPAPAPAPPAAPTDAQRIAAAQATVANNGRCSAATLGPYYWEVGDGSGPKVWGSVGGGAPGADTVLGIASASKWLYAMQVLQLRGLRSEDVPYLNFTSGYTRFGLPSCGRDPTVAACLAGRDARDDATIGKFFYDSGHMQVHAGTVMDLGAADNAALAAGLNNALGVTGLAYAQPQLAAGVQASARSYATVLGRVLRGELAMRDALGSHKVCANPSLCADALAAPALGSNERWNYALGHWVEDDPALGDHAFSSAGGTGFYPWIDAAVTHYGVIARERVEADAGFHSAECGRLVRQAWRTGVAATGALPVP
ncbi:hypothetical protein ACPOLB_19735 [Rubrivivax sp. RP6-9]|uniref:hypothetical protein n=1 Tax=Rubrivivax sp. RP6-9 TaxID=3415750 RepID=UPI003CC5A062